MANYVNRLTIELDGDTAVVRGMERISSASGKTATKIKEDNSQVKGSNKEAEDSFSGVEAASGRLRGALVFAAGAAGFGALTFGVSDVIQAGVRFQEQNAQMVQALKSTGAYSKEAASGLSDYSEKLATRGGFTADTNLENLTKLITVTGSATKAQAQLNLATDIARRYHVSLAAATKAVMQADAGRTTGLARLTGATATNLTGEQALAIARAKTAGATAAYSRTVQGAMSNASGAIDNAGRAVSQALLPYIAKLAMWMANTLPGAISKTIKVVKDLVGWFKQHMAITKAVAVGLGVLVTGFIALKIISTVTKLWEALNLAMDANPIAIVVIAIAALAAGLSYAYEKVGWFHNAVNAVFSFVKTHWQLIGTLLLGPVFWAATEIIKHFGSILSFVESLPKRISSAATGMWDGLKTGLTSVLNWVIDRINDVIKAINSADHISVFGHRIGAPSIGTIGHVGGSGPSTGATSSNLNALPKAREGAAASVRANASQASAMTSTGAKADHPVINNHINNVLNLDGKRISKSVQRNARIAHVQQGAYVAG